MSLCEQIKQALHTKLQPTVLEVIDESAAHQGHAGLENSRSQESHFFVHIVSPHFCDLSLVEQHRLVYTALEQQINKGVHALRLQTSS